MQIVKKNILTVERGIICQQVNCQGVMGSGLAKQIRNKWPDVYDGYIKFCDFYKKREFQMLGKVLWISKLENPNLVIANIFGQLHYGYDGKRYTDYAALNEAFNFIECHHFYEKVNKEIYFPFNFGCDRGGGDWNIVSKMIEFYFPAAIVCKLF